MFVVQCYVGMEKWDSSPSSITWWKNGRLTSTPPLLLTAGRSCLLFCPLDCPERCALSLTSLKALAGLENAVPLFLSVSWVVIFHFDYCNIILIGLPAKSSSCLHGHHRYLKPQETFLWLSVHYLLLHLLRSCFLTQVQIVPAVLAHPTSCSHLSGFWSEAIKANCLTPLLVTYYIYWAQEDPNDCFSSWHFVAQI